MNKHKNRMPGSNGTHSRTKRAGGQALQETRHIIGEYPASSALTTFVVGCGLGLLTAWLIAPQRRSRRWYEFSHPAWASSDRLSKAAEALPRAVGSYFSHR